MHSSVIAHQCFALKALSWLGQVIQYSGRLGLHYPQCLCVSAAPCDCRNVSDGLRRTLCQVGLQEGPEGQNSSLVDRLMLNDSKMWKGNETLYIHTTHKLRSSTKVLIPVLLLLQLLYLLN